MTDPRALRRPRQLVIAAQSLSLLSVVLQFVVHSWPVTLSLAVLAAVVAVTVAVSRPVAGLAVRWLTGLGSAGVAAALLSLWLIRDEDAAIPIGQVGGLLLSFVVTIAMVIVLVGELRRSDDATA